MRTVRHIAFVVRSVATLGMGVVACAAAAPAQAQVSELLPGARARIEAPSVLAGRRTGVIIAATADSIRFAMESAPIVSVPVRAITRVDISRGKSAASGALRGAYWGLGIGLGSGLITAAVGENCTPSEVDCASKGQFVAESALGGVILGSVIGAIVRRETWQALSLPARVTLMPRQGGATVGLAIRF